MTDENQVRCFEELHSLELAVVTGKTAHFNTQDFQNALNSDDKEMMKKLVTVCEYMVKSDYESILNSNVIDDIFHSLVDGSREMSLSEIFKHMSDIIENISTKCDPSSHAMHYILLFVGVAALQTFVQYNWTGPGQNNQTFNFINNLFHSASCKKDALKLLSNHEEIYHNVKCPELLVLSKFLISSVEGSVTCTINWWMMRSLMIHQQVLLEKSTELYDQIRVVMANTNTSLDCFDSQTKVQLNIESGIIHLYYHEITPAKHYFSKALDIIGLDIELSGAFGKRTHFQSKPVAQLFVKVHWKSDSTCESSTESLISYLPKDLVLEDEVLLSKVKFIDSDENVIQNLLPEEQIVILSQCCLVQKNNPSDELLTEQIMAYLDCILAHPSVWSIQMKALIMRSKLEKHKSRKVERAMMQLEALLNTIKNEVPDLKIRQYMFYSTLFPSSWILEKELADLLISLGAVKSALDIYLRLELWEDIVNCYQILDQNEKAATIVRQKLAENETPLLWCILGDVTNEILFYYKAWDLSNHRSARAQRSLGYFYYKKRDYVEAIPFFRKALEINHLQLNVWFSLAFAAAQTSDYTLASQAYRHVVVMDPENFEAWNNLSNAYIRLNQKVRAYRTLQEALKCNFEHWKIWENYLLVCMDVGAFEDGIQAYHRLLDIKGKHEDAEILTILVKAIITNVPDINGQPASHLKQKALQLLGRLTSIITNNSDIWKQYALLYSSEPQCNNNKDIMERVITYQHKAHKCDVQRPNWEKDLSSCQRVILDAIYLGELYCNYLLMLEGNVRSQGKSSAKLMLRNVLVRVEKQLRDYYPNDAEKLEQHLETLREILTKVETLDI